MRIHHFSTSYLRDPQDKDTLCIFLCMLAEKDFESIHDLKNAALKSVASWAKKRGVDETYHLARAMKSYRITTLKK